MQRLFALTVLMFLLLSVTQVSAETPVIDLSHAEFSVRLSANPDAVIIDVRSAAEFAQGRVPNAINIPHGDILDDVSLLDQYQGKALIFYCRSGARAGRVTKRLSETGYNQDAGLYHLDGDMLGWEAANQTIEK